MYIRRIHVVEEKVDEGRIICVSQRLVVEPDRSVEEHQELMKTFCDGPAYKRALELIVEYDLIGKTM